MFCVLRASSSSTTAVGSVTPAHVGYPPSGVVALAVIDSGPLEWTTGSIAAVASILPLASVMLSTVVPCG